MLHFQGFLGIGVLIAIAWLCSENRKQFQWRIVIGALGVCKFRQPRYSDWRLEIDGPGALF